VCDHASDPASADKLEVRFNGLQQVSLPPARTFCTRTAERDSKTKPRTECAGRGIASSQSHRYLAVIQWLAVHLRTRQFVHRIRRVQELV